MQITKCYKQEYWETIKQLRRQVDQSAKPKMNDVADLCSISSVIHANNSNTTRRNTRAGCFSTCAKFIWSYALRWIKNKWTKPKWLVNDTSYKYIWERALCIHKLSFKGLFMTKCISQWVICFKTLEKSVFKYSIRLLRLSPIWQVHYGLLWKLGI